MRIIPQMKLFGYNDNEILGDLERLQMVIDHMLDGKIIYKLYKIRGKGRNDWPVEALWNSFLASFVFGYRSISDLLRELKRNRQLREMCGSEPKSVLDEDRRIFLPVGRQSMKFKRLYKKRIGVTFLVGLTMAKAKIERGNRKNLASLVS